MLAGFLSLIAPPQGLPGHSTKLLLRKYNFWRLQHCFCRMQRHYICVWAEFAILVSLISFIYTTAILTTIVLSPIRTVNLSEITLNITITCCPTQWTGSLYDERWDVECSPPYDMLTGMGFSLRKKIRPRRHFVWWMKCRARPRLLSTLISRPCQSDILRSEISSVHPITSIRMGYRSNKFDAIICELSCKYHG